MSKTRVEMYLGNFIMHITIIQGVLALSSVETMAILAYYKTSHSIKADPTETLRSYVNYELITLVC